MPEHKCLIKWNPEGGSSNVRSHFRIHHPDFFEAMEHASSNGEDPEVTMRTLLNAKQMKKKGDLLQQRVNCLFARAYDSMQIL